MPRLGLEVTVVLQPGGAVRHRWAGGVRPPETAGLSSHRHFPPLLLRPLLPLLQEHQREVAPGNKGDVHLIELSVN